MDDSKNGSRTTEMKLLNATEVILPFYDPDARVAICFVALVSYIGMISGL